MNHASATNISVFYLLALIASFLLFGVVSATKAACSSTEYNDPASAIFVVGSVNFDVTLHTELPKSEETMRAYNSNIHRALGGKGANQAVGVKKSLMRPNQSEVYFVGKFGDDDEGKWLSNTLSDEYSINLKYSESIQNVSSGTGIVLLSKKGVASSSLSRAPTLSGRSRKAHFKTSSRMSFLRQNQKYLQTRAWQVIKMNTVQTLRYRENLFFCYSARFLML